MADSRSVSLLVYGKVNLTLAITGRRADGYHTLSGAMQSIGLSNRLTLAVLPKSRGRVVLRCDDPALPTDRKNTAVRAAEDFLQATACPDGLLITLEKHIPYQAGLGSASADAAGVLAGANRLFGFPLSTAALHSLAVKTGADVAFCLGGGTQRAEGIGELLTPLPELPPCYFLIAKPPEGVSTPEAYARFDELAAPVQPDCAALEQALSAGSLGAVAAACGNAFEQCCPVEAVAALKAAMKAQGALGGAMSGSGTAVFGIFESAQQAEDARCALVERFPACRWYLAAPEKSAIRFV